MYHRHHITLAIAAAALASFTTVVAAQDHAGAHQHGAHSAANPPHASASTGPHGGSLQMVDAHRVETVIMPKGIMFMILDEKDNAVAAPDASGKLTLRVGENPKEYSYELRTLKNQAIGVAIDLSKVVGHALHLDVELSNVGAQPLSFHAMGKIASSELPDTLLISLQATCPVTGKPLGSMGAPPKIVVDGKPLFVCCAGCSSKVQNSPEPYLSKYYTAKGEEVRPGVFKATLADASAIGAQKTCPVMDEELGGMGGPLKVNVNGKAVYICCEGCAKKLAAAPEEYLAKLAKQGVTPPNMN